MAGQRRDVADIERVSEKNTLAAGDRLTVGDDELEQDARVVDLGLRGRADGTVFADLGVGQTLGHDQVDDILTWWRGDLSGSDRSRIISGSKTVK